MLLEPLMTLSEVARYLRCHPSTVYKLLRKGGLPGIQVANEWRFKRSLINDWIQQQQEVRIDG